MDIDLRLNIQFILIQNVYKYGYGSILLKELIKECRKNKKIKNLIAVVGGSDNIASIKNTHKKWFKYIG